MVAHTIVVGGQNGWEHNEGHAYGFFHTFDALKIKDEPARKIHIFLPESYNKNNKKKRYPVIYMHDGHTAFWPGGIGGRSWQVAETLSQPELRNSIEEVIVVGIHPLDRMREMTHTTFRWNGEERPSGGLREYTAYVADVLKPWIDLNYRTDDAASKTAVCGSSLGGLAAFYMAGTRPDCFGIGACFSSAFGVGLDPSDTIAGSELMRLVEKNLSSSSNSNRPKFWVDWGVPEGRLAIRGREMVQLLLQSDKFRYRLNEDLFFYEDLMGGHNEAAWAFRFPIMLKCFYSLK